MVYPNIIVIFDTITRGCAITIYTTVLTPMSDIDLKEMVYENYVSGMTFLLMEEVIQTHWINKAKYTDAESAFYILVSQIANFFC